MDLYDEDDQDDDFEVAEERTEGECDHCFGETVQTPFGPLYCACEIGQGAPPENCACGPAG